MILKWRNFQKITAKAKIACENTGDEIDDHFLDASRKVIIGSRFRSRKSD